jgi:hypothetical protein
MSCDHNEDFALGLLMQHLSVPFFQGKLHRLFEELVDVLLLLRSGVTFFGT